MYTSEIDNTLFAIKPMNCPGALLVYQNTLHSYKEFPLRVAELGLVHRHEASGALHGLLRVRMFTQDDAHIFMMEDQIEEEVIRLINFFEKIYNIFGLDYSIELSTKPEENAIGEPEIWEKAEKALAEACKKANRNFKLNPGDGAFYGPKLDFHLKDSLGRTWQCGTIQLDFNLPERFDLTYIDKDGLKKRPVMLHRVVFGSIERFIGILIEHYAGAFPTWLAPVQTIIIPVNNEAHLEFSQELYNKMLANNIRVEIDMREEKLGYKIREAQTRKIPYQLAIGDKEVESASVTVRKYGSKEQYTIKIDKFIDALREEIKNKNV
jgi:threonyl-tRNA synthetase